MGFYAWNVLFAIVAIFIYIFFRWGVYGFLRVAKNSKSFIRKNKKGFLNFWFYRSINEQTNMGLVYHLNAFLLGLTLLYCGATFAFGWIRIFRLPIAILDAVLCIVQVIAIIFSDVYQNLECKKSAFIVFRIDKETKKVESSFVTLLGICLLLFLAIYNISLAL